MRWRRLPKRKTCWRERSGTWGGRPRKPRSTRGCCAPSSTSRRTASRSWRLSWPWWGRKTDWDGWSGASWLTDRPAGRQTDSNQCFQKLFTSFFAIVKHQFSPFLVFDGTFYMRRIKPTIESKIRESTVVEAQTHMHHLCLLKYFQYAVSHYVLVWIYCIWSNAGSLWMYSIDIPHVSNPPDE